MAKVAPPYRSRRRRHSPDDYSARLKRSRREYSESVYVKEIPRERRSSVERYGMRREMFMNGGYSEYMREYHQQRPPVPQMPYGPPYSAQAPYPIEMPYYDRATVHHHHHHSEFGNPRSRPMDKRSYERSVDDFLRRTTRPPSRADRRYRDRR